MSKILKSSRALKVKAVEVSSPSSDKVEVMKLDQASPVTPKIKEKFFKNALFIFRRDIRLHDNTALLEASRLSMNIIPTFFLDERQVDKSQNSFFSSNCVQFMLQSLNNLDQALRAHNSRLFIFNGKLLQNLQKIIENFKIDALFINQDYTPFAIKRDKEIEEFCVKNKIVFRQHEDLLLIDLMDVLQGTGVFYKKFTPFFNVSSSITVRKPNTFKVSNFIKAETFESQVPFSLKYSSAEDLYEAVDIKLNPAVEITGGRQEGEKILESLEKFKNYTETRNYPILKTSRLSAYLKFGCVSVREVFYKLKEKFGGSHDLIRQLHWRDFYTKIAFFFPHVVGKSMKPDYDKIVWKAEEYKIEAWKKGNTGFPIVDSAMRCLNETGWMHNRLRMVVSSFLIKDIQADWRVGEKYFAQTLIDYDLSLNNGGWQWAASTGTDSQPYFRIFNPALQSEKFDRNCEFIRRWIPELKNVAPEHIHNWEKFHSHYKGKVKYPSPILNHAVQKELTIQMYKSYVYGEKSAGKYDDEKSDEEEEEIMDAKKPKKVRSKSEGKSKAIDNYFPKTSGKKK